jgi:hypothetical protein
MERSEPRQSLIRTLARLSPLWMLCLMAGVYGGLLGWRAGAFLMLTGVIGSISCHLVIGIVAYRNVMMRPWPKVVPLDDDEDW